MKKIFFLLCVLMCSSFAFAQEYSINSSGERQFDPLYKWGVYNGSEFSVGLGGVRTSNDDNSGRAYADPGFMGNASLLIEMSPSVSSGIDYMYSGFRTSENAGGPDYTLYAHHISAAFKVRFNPKDKLRFYLPVGAGAGGFVLKTRPAQGEETRSEKWNLALYAGVGMEVDISPVVFLGAEYRYIYSFVQESDVDFSDGSNRYFQSHVFMFKIGMRLF